MARRDRSSFLILRNLLAVSITGLACQEQSYDSYRGRPVQTTDQSQDQGATKNTPTTNTNTPAAQDAQAPGSPGTPAAPAPAQPLTDPQALSLVRGSCIYAGCHADAAVIMASPNILPQLRDNLMPPPTQQRYTLRSADRAALVAYFQSKVTATAN